MPDNFFFVSNTRFCEFYFLSGGTVLYFFKYYWTLIWHIVKWLGINLILLRLVLGVVRVSLKQPEVSG